MEYAIFYEKLGWTVKQKDDAGGVTALLPHGLSTLEEAVQLAAQHSNGAIGLKLITGDSF